MKTTPGNFRLILTRHSQYSMVPSTTCTPRFRQECANESRDW
jgi:hypothetical protein